MESRLRLKDLPTDWFKVMGHDIIEQLTEEFRMADLSLRRTIFFRFSQYDKHRFQMGVNSLSDTLPLHQALRLCNVPAFCYSVTPRFLGGVHPMRWRQEMFNHWIRSMEPGRTYDIKNPVAFVSLHYTRCEEYNHYPHWIGLGIKGTLEPEQRQEQQEADLASLIHNHECLCDLVQERMRGSLDDNIDSPYALTERDRIQPTVSPISRAVFLMAPEDLRDDRAVLLVLTGDNGGLLSTAPSFDTIRRTEILGRRGDQAVEVTLKTAMQYLRHLDTAEERVNDVYRSSMEQREEKLVADRHERATELVTAWSKRDDGDSVIYERPLRRAMIHVMAWREERTGPAQGW